MTSYIGELKAAFIICGCTNSAFSIISDTYEFSLSEEQREIFDGWKRPSDLTANWAQSNGKTPSEPTMLPTEPMDLVQDVTTDCSVVASLCTGRSPCGPAYSKVRITRCC